MKNKEGLKTIFVTILLIFVLSNPGFCQKKESVELEYLNWLQAEKVLKKYQVALISLGARTKEHGPHLPLNNDYIMAEYLKKRVMKEVPVVVLPTLQYGFYPAFLEYPGSVSVNSVTFRNLLMAIALSPISASGCLPIVNQSVMR